MFVFDIKVSLIWDFFWMEFRGLFVLYLLECSLCDLEHINFSYHYQTLPQKKIPLQTPDPKKLKRKKIDIENTLDIFLFFTSTKS
jgi:hypothetical protein